MIELKEVSCSFSDGFGGKGLFTAVSPLNAHFSDGGRYAIVGESGSGKTTLARMIAGLQRPSGGSVFVDVSFENVTFAYENTDHPAVSHLSFTAKAGTTTALVGHSGSGKSTTASLIPRFYDVQQGAVKIGGVDIREIPHADLMKMVAFVFQDPKLFKDTLLENIRAGRPSATRDEVLQAARLAQCDDILEKFPDGLDTVVGSKGVYLSGGETQRIAIARAILKDAPIVVLDEATAYADPENEQQIQKAFEGLVKGKTVIMIAHRLSTIQDADLILVMKQGELVESGTHDALVKQGGEYAKMWSNYTKTTKWHIGNEVKVC